MQTTYWEDERVDGGGSCCASCCCCCESSVSDKPRLRFVLPDADGAPLSSCWEAAVLRLVDGRESASASSDISISAGVLGISCLILRCVAEPGSVFDSSLDAID